MSSAHNVRIWVLVAVGLVVIGGLGWMIFQNFEKVEETFVRPPSREARSNPALAAKRLFDDLGLETRTERNLRHMPPTNHVLIHAVERRVTTHERTQRLIEWVSDGGYLIIGPYLEYGMPTDETSGDPLLAELGIAVYAISDDYETDVYGMSFEEDEHKLRVKFSTSVGIDSPTDEDNYVLSHIADVGDGTILFLNDLDFLRNDEIGNHDHAAFLWRIATLEGPREGAMIVYAESSLSLFGQLMRHAWLALLATAVWLAAWCLRVGSRFGPIKPARIPERRSLMEHIQALGVFLSGRNRHDVLVDSVRTDVLRMLLTKQPELAQRSADERAESVAKMLGLPAAKAREALVELPPDGRKAYVDVMRTLQELRSKL